MTREYWDKKFIQVWDNDISLIPSIFAKYAVSFFPKHGKILEIGTGKGGDANFFQLLGYEVVATDYSAEALKIAKKNFKNIKFINLDTREGLPFTDESFDVVYSHMALHYFDEMTTRKIFQDIYRVLKHGGIFSTMTNTIDDTGKGSIEIENDFYKNPESISRRYFSVDSMKRFTKDLFKTIVLDNKGESNYKNDIKTLIRFVGNKI